jgi:hypothetical protein
MRIRRSVRIALRSASEKMMEMTEKKTVMASSQFQELVR